VSAKWVRAILPAMIRASESVRWLRRSKARWSFSSALLFGHGLRGEEPEARQRNGVSSHADSHAGVLASIEKRVLELFGGFGEAAEAGQEDAALVGENRSP